MLGPEGLPDILRLRRLWQYFNCSPAEFDLIDQYTLMRGILHVEVADELGLTI